MKIIVSNHRSAFTLVEIMIVVAIIGTLSAVVIPNFIASRETTIKNKCLADIRQIESGLTTATLDTNASINNLSEDGIKTVIEPNYVKSMPNCSRGIYSTDSSGSAHCSVHLPGNEGGGGSPPHGYSSP